MFEYIPFSLCCDRQPDIDLLYEVTCTCSIISASVSDCSQSCSPGEDLVDCAYCTCIGTTVSGQVTDAYGVALEGVLVFHDSQQWYIILFLSIHPFVCPYIHPSMHPLTKPSIHPSIHPY